MSRIQLASQPGKHKSNYAYAVANNPHSTAPPPPGLIQQNIYEQYKTGCSIDIAFKWPLQLQPVVNNKCRSKMCKNNTNEKSQRFFATGGTCPFHQGCQEECANWQLQPATCNLQLAAKLPLAAFNWLLLGHVQRQLPPCALEQFLSKLWHKLAAPLHEIEDGEGERGRERRTEREKVKSE